MKAKNDITTKIYSEVFEVKEQHEKVNQYVKAVIVNFGDERGDIIVSNDNFGTRRKYADFTKGKQAAGIHPLQVVFSDVDVAAALKDRYIGPDNQVHVFGEPIEAEEIMDDLGEMHDIELDARNVLPGWEYDEEHVILENTAGRYIVGKIYDNCVSIGSGHVREFETPVEAVKALQNGFEIKNVGPLGDQERAKRSEALSKAQAKYDGRQRKVTIRLDEQADADLIARIEAQPSMTAYIKELVRRDMER